MDPITDLLNQIKNAQAVHHSTVEIPFSKLKYEIAKVLLHENFVTEIKKKKKIKKGIIEIALKYSNGNPGISAYKRVSKPGQRIYRRFKELKPVKGGYGISIISTSKGLVTDKKARKLKIGGEVLCEIW